MNSLSGYFYKDDYNLCKREKKGEKYCPMNLKCGSAGSANPIPNGILPTSPLILTRISVNIPKCCDPCAIIEFASTVNFIGPIGGGAATFTVSIFKNCLNNIRIPLGSYTFSRVSFGAAFTATETFNFFVCDCDTCLFECCYYSAEITTSNFQIGGDGGRPIVSINNAILSAIAGESDC